MWNSEEVELRPPNARVELQRERRFAVGRDYCRARNLHQFSVPGTSDFSRASETLAIIVPGPFVSSNDLLGGGAPHSGL